MVPRNSVWIVFAERKGLNWDEWRLGTRPTALVGRA